MRLTDQCATRDAIKVQNLPATLLDALKTVYQVLLGRQADLIPNPLKHLGERRKINLLVPPFNHLAKKG